jgi:undecaprenyl-diphosphatase
MNSFQAIFLGILQGITEFLPISSDGHLVIFSKLLGITSPDNTYDIMLHLGTLVSICFVFSRDLSEIFRNCFKQNSSLQIQASEYKKPNRSSGICAHLPFKTLVMGIIVASIPTAIIGLYLKNFVELSARSYIFVGFMLWITGLLLFLTRCRKNSSSTKFTMWHAAAIGIAQGIAVLPGVSRSGSTIALSLILGLDRQLAGRFSFLIAIPAIAGAVLVKFSDFERVASDQLGLMILGTVIAGLVGIFALKVLLKILMKGSLHKFAYYCFVAGAVCIGLEYL